MAPDADDQRLQHAADTQATRQSNWKACLKDVKQLEDFRPLLLEWLPWNLDPNVDLLQYLEVVSHNYDDNGWPVVTEVRPRLNVLSIAVWDWLPDLASGFESHGSELIQAFVAYIFERGVNCTRAIASSFKTFTISRRLAGTEPIGGAFWLIRDEASFFAVYKKFLYSAATFANSYAKAKKRTRNSSANGNARNTTDYKAIMRYLRYAVAW